MAGRVQVRSHGFCDEFMPYPLQGCRPEDCSPSPSSSSGSAALSTQAYVTAEYRATGSQNAFSCVLDLSSTELAE